MMSSVDLEMDDLFEEQGENDLNADLSHGIPDLDIDVPDVSQTQAPTQTQDDSEVVAKLRGAEKKRVIKPQPKLDALRLKGDRGLPILPKVFEKVKFKGKGHETEDLKLMMGKLEHWGHRLYPKLPFDELVERLEKLGSKKEVQTCIKRIRLDMPILDEDFTGPGEQDIPADADNEGQVQGGQVQNAEDLFEEMLREEHEIFGEGNDRSPPPSPTYGSRNRVPSSPASGENRLQTSPSPASPAPAVKQSPKSAKTSAPASVTGSQKERMERNKRMALEKRAKRLGITVEALQQQITPKSKSTAKTNDDQIISSSRSSQDKVREPTNQNTSIIIEPIDGELTLSDNPTRHDTTAQKDSTTIQDTTAEEFILAEPTKSPENDCEIPKLVLDLSEEDNDMQTSNEMIDMSVDESRTIQGKKQLDTSQKPSSDSHCEAGMEIDNSDGSEIISEKYKKDSMDVDANMDISETVSDHAAEIPDNEKENIDSSNIDAKSDISEQCNNNAEKDNVSDNNIDTSESQSLSILSS